VERDPSGEGRGGPSEAGPYDHRGSLGPTGERERTPGAPWRPRRPLCFRDRIGDLLWEELVGGIPVVRIRASDPILLSGAQPCVTAVISGLVRVFTWTPGGRQVAVRYARPGDLLGLAAFLAGSEMLSAEAVMDTVHAPLTLQRLRAMADRHPDLGWKIAEQVATWGMTSVLSLVGAGFEHVRARVARHLLDLATLGPDGRTVAYVTHRSLADAAGTAREVVTRVLGEYREQGILETRAGRVIVLEPDRLARALDEEPAAAPSGQAGGAELGGPRAGSTS
jgi:CRP/FNR family transcriptional regulator, cyclic AMP receptor protein